MRILGRYFQNQLPDPEKIIFQHYLQSNPIDFRGQKKLTRAAALLEINEIEAKNTLDDEQKKLLAGLKKLINEKQT